MYNLLEYSDNYSVSSVSLWNYYRGKIDVINFVSDDKSFKYNSKITGKTPARPARRGNERDLNRPQQPPVPPLNTEVTILFYSNILVISIDLLICLLLTVK